MRIHRLVALVLFLCLSPIVRAGAGDHLVAASLLSNVSAIKPGEPFTLGILLKIQPGWHIYWMNPGDSGGATNVKLTLPDGFTSEPVQYPVPSRINLNGSIVNYVYTNATMLMVRVTPPKNLIAGAVPFAASIRWTVCKENCELGSAAVSLNLPVSVDATPANEDVFQKWESALPAAHDAERVEAVATNQDLKAAGGDRLVGDASITVRWKSAPGDIDWFPAVFSGVYITDIKMSTHEKTTTISYHVDAASSAGNPPAIQSVLAYTLPDGHKTGLSIGTKTK